jgi:RNA polymerase sigma-70 factor (ECF subfamily)
MGPKSESLLAKLLHQARDEHGARNELFARCRSILLLMARAYARHFPEARLDASDLVQQTLLDAHRAFEAFRGKSPGELLAWLRQILENNAHDAARRLYQAQKRSLKKEVPLQTHDDSGQAELHLPADTWAPVDKLAAREREALLHQALEQLPPLYRQVLIWRHLQGLPFAEIAQRLQRSRPAVQMIWLRAVKRLRQLLAGTSLQKDFDGTG